MLPAGGAIERTLSMIGIAWILITIIRETKAIGHFGRLHPSIAPARVRVGDDSRGLVQSFA